MADIYARRVFEFMYDVGANNIKLGRDRKMAWAREVVLAWKAAVNRQPHPYWELFFPTLLPKLSPIIIGRTVNLCMRCLTKCPLCRVFPSIIQRLATQLPGLCSYGQLFPSKRKLRDR